MLREINEQPVALSTTLSKYVDGDRFREDVCAPVRAWLLAAKDEIVIAASGSSRHAGMVAEIMFEDISGIHVDVEYASEYTYRAEKALKRASVMVISQSGETADTLAALRKAKAAGHPTLAITNVASSSMANDADVSFPTEAGRERAVPATKSFTAQLQNIYLLALLAAEELSELTKDEVSIRLAELAAAPAAITAQLPAWTKSIEVIAEKYRTSNSFLFLGRDLHYPIAREGALKLKESAYLHAEGYPSGELKHGPNALVAEGTPLVMLATYDPNDDGSILRYEKVLQLMTDMRKQGAEILAVANTEDNAIAALASDTIFVEPAREALLPIFEAIPLQLLSYFAAIQNGIDVDHPRNLTKAVLAE
ncbi:SIS domain-containing protein [Granulicella paludicola]|uniref:SIS domain-containing protein n=1 Tax=Granulicella paludicola TaxID=474951 RepID=UPI0021E09B59|nr:SIS domain-containing protein [Granulicella paludicola]